MNNFTEVLRRHFPALLVGAFMYGIYLFYTYSGSRICDCEKTENYRPSSGGRLGVNRFYHK
jgi:hypothetical protein